MYKRQISKFPNLKVLTLNESNVNNISELEPLKKLEYLDLASTNVSDVHILNSLPNLKEVNLATWSNEDLESQLDRPEIGIYCGLPTIYINVWREDDFGI